MSACDNNSTFNPVPHGHRPFALTITAGFALGIVGCQAPESPASGSDSAPMQLAGETIVASCPAGGDLVLTNGQIITVDADDSIVSSVRIRQDRILGVGNDVGILACDQVIDLDGRTVVPGLQNNHMHYLRAGMRPGHGISAVETATTRGWGRVWGWGGGEWPLINTLQP